MQFDVEATMQQNIRLKKALQMSRFQFQKLQKQLKQLRQTYQQELTKNKTLKTEYCQLNRKYQQSYTQSIKDSNSLINQIQDLKKIIDQKQRDMQALQIKLIPTLDQDMLRVKLITQMQGPYQQTVQRKDRQIQKLKNKVTELERNLQITSLSMKSKLREYKKQNQDIKLKYEQENNRIMQELNLALSRNQVQSVEASIIKNQRKEIDELRTTIKFVQDNEENHLNQIKQLKIERKSLLEKLIILNTKEALLIQGEHNLKEMEKLKDEKFKMIKQIENMKIQQDKLLRQVRKIQQQKTKIISQFDKQLSTERNNFITERNHLTNQLYTLKEQIKRLRNTLIADESDKQARYQKIRLLQQEVYQKTREIESLKIQNSRYSYKNNEETVRPKENQQRQNQSLKQQYRQRQRQRQRQKQNQKVTLRKLQKSLAQFQRQNEKLKKKLSEANDKIMELIRNKLKAGKGNSPQRDRIKSSIDKPRGVFLEYEDCGFQPLVEPTLYTYNNRAL